ncbi:MAG TPA: sigma-70 family RNA polymerase sigma factor [Candidatus Saccharimonadales bacterium]|nr:sigma-70 family RNA polymerase sigma factor [Candidatus Saccharimonadales bacterium]
MELFVFDAEYVNRLRDGDQPTEKHFVAYFQQLLKIKLRARFLPPDKVEDLTQETFIRVIGALRREGGVRQPERFGAFVNSICNNVVFERHRTTGRDQPLEETHLEIADRAPDPEKVFVSNQIREQVRDILDDMPRRDRDLLRAIFLEEKEKDEVCQEFGVDRNYLRVCLHRAKERFREVYAKEQPAFMAKARVGRAGIG